MQNDNLRQAIAEQRSFTNSAVIVLLLYFVFYLPGLILNIVYLNEARGVQRTLGRPPAGMGCLWSLLLIMGVLGAVPVCLVLSGIGYPFLRGLLGYS